VRSRDAAAASYSGGALGAFVGDQLVGAGSCAAVSSPCVRACAAPGLLVDRWAAIVPVARLLVCSRLIVAQTFRGRSRASSALVEAMYVAARELNVAVGCVTT
jgi:hypothetical protein